MTKEILSKRKWRKAEYSRAAKTLRRLGYSITYKANDRRTFTQRGIIRRLYEDKKAFILFTEQNPNAKTRVVAGEEYQFKFVKLSSKRRKEAKASNLFSEKQYTKGGVFVEKPKNIPAKDFKIKFTKRGVVMKAGKRSDLIVYLDPRKLAVDPTDAIDNAIKGLKFSQVALMVNGWRPATTQSMSLRQFYLYLKDELLPDWMNRQSKYYETGEEANEGFSDLFHVKLLR